MFMPLFNINGYINLTAKGSHYRTVFLMLGLVEFNGHTNDFNVW